MCLDTGRARVCAHVLSMCVCFNVCRSKKAGAFPWMAVYFNCICLKEFRLLLHVLNVHVVGSFSCSLLRGVIICVAHVCCVVLSLVSFRLLCVYCNLPVTNWPSQFYTQPRSACQWVWMLASVTHALGDGVQRGRNHDRHLSGRRRRCKYKSATVVSRRSSAFL